MGPVSARLPTHTPTACLNASIAGPRGASPSPPASPLQEQITAATAHYELLKGRNLSELERLNLERADDFRAALRHFSRVQAQMACAVAEVWRSAGLVGAGAAAE